jgi:hypothetical protein
MHICGFFMETFPSRVALLWCIKCVFIKRSHYEGVQLFSAFVCLIVQIVIVTIHQLFRCFNVI